MAIATELWDAGIKAEFTWKVKPKFDKQFKQADQGGVPFAVILGEDELAQGKLKIKELGLPDGHAAKDGVMIEKSDLVKEVKSRLQASAEKQSTLENGVASLAV
jgi:histidyl-tRNA synthetase